MPSPTDAKIAELLLKHGLVAARDLEEALPSSRDGSPLDALLARKKLDPDAAASIAEAARGSRSAVATPADLALCAACAERKLVSPADLQAGLSAQRKLAQQLKLRRPLGEILWSMRKLELPKLEELNRVVRARLPEADREQIDPVVLTPEQDARVSRAIDGGKFVAKEKLELTLRAAQALMRLGMERKMGEILLVLGAIRMSDIEALPAAGAPKPRKTQPVRQPGSPASRPVPVVARAAADSDGAGEEPELPRVRRRSNTTLVSALYVVGALVILGGGAAVFLKADRAAGPSSWDTATGPVIPDGGLAKAPSNGPAEIRVPSSALVGLKSDAKAALGNRLVFRAQELYEVLVKKGSPEDPQRAEIERRWRQTSAMTRTLQAMFDGINARKSDPIAFQFDSGTSRLIEGADRMELSVWAKSLDLRSKLAWAQVSATDTVALMVESGAAAKEPLGAVAYAVQFADGRGAEPLLASLTEAQRNELAEWYPGTRIGGPEATAGGETTPGGGKTGETPGGTGTGGGTDTVSAEQKAREERAKAAAEAISRARNLAAGAKSAEALEGLKPALVAARGTDQEKALQAVWDEIAVRFVRTLDGFDAADCTSRWQAVGGSIEWNQAADQVHAGAGSLKWLPGTSDVSALVAAAMPADWTTYPCLSLWAWAEKKGSEFEIRVTSGPQDGLAFTQAIDWTGWKRLRVRLDKFRRQGRPDLTKVDGFGFFMYKAGTAGALAFDELQLEAETVPPILGGEAPGTGGAETPGAGNGGPDPGGKTPGAGTAEAAAQKRWPRPTARHYVNLDHGVAVLPPQGWNTIPAPKEVNQEFRRDEAIKTLVRFDDKNPDPQNFGISMELCAIPNAATLDEAVQTFLGSLREQVAPEGKQPVRIGPWKGVFFQVPGRFFQNVVVMQEGGRAASMAFTSGEKYGRKKADQFRQMAMTFLFISDADLLKLKAKKAGQTDLPAGWKVHLTPHYEIQYNSEDEFAKQVGKHLEAILKEYLKRWPLDSSMDETTGKIETALERFTVKIFKTNEEFNSYAAANGVGGAAAYFSPMQNELVGYKTTDQGKDKTFHIMYHEASHQYLHMYMGREVDLPIWLNEGVAEYFYGGEFKPDGSFRIEENKDRIADIKEAIRIGTYVPLKDIFQYSQAQYYSNAGICYAEGWSIAYFLWTTKDPKYAGRLDKYYDVLKTSGSKDEAHQAAFGDLDIGVFEEDWKKYILTL